MASDEDISAKRERLDIYRRNLAYYLNQLAMTGQANAPISVINGIYEARTNIRELKATLREWNVAVEDDLDDEELPAPAPAMAAAPAAAPAPAEASPAAPAAEATPEPQPVAASAAPPVEAAPEPQPAPAAPPPPAAFAAADAYVTPITRKLRHDGYELSEKERWGTVRFRLMASKFQDVWLGKAQHAIVFFERPGLTADDYHKLDKELREYASDLSQAAGTMRVHLLGVLITDEVNDEFMNLICETEPEKPGFFSNYTIFLVVYSARANDIYYYKNPPDDSEAAYDTKLKTYLVP